MFEKEKKKKMKNKFLTKFNFCKCLKILELESRFKTLNFHFDKFPSIISILKSLSEK